MEAEIAAAAAAPPPVKKKKKKKVVEESLDDLLSAGLAGKKKGKVRGWRRERVHALTVPAAGASAALQPRMTRHHYCTH